MFLKGFSMVKQSFWALATLGTLLFALPACDSSCAGGTSTPTTTVQTGSLSAAPSASVPRGASTDVNPGLAKKPLSAQELFGTPSATPTK
jgi:hypothetical protein